MYKTIMMTASVIALVASVPAWAETEAKVQTSVETRTSTDTGMDASQAWNNIKEDASEIYDDIRAVFIDDENHPVVINKPFEIFEASMTGCLIDSIFKEREKGIYLTEAQRVLVNWRACGIPNPILDQQAFIKRKPVDSEMSSTRMIEV
ncbi:MAG: hypothetical protein K9G62_06435 [Alphaproteobacteria bacterium]|nr:hypothetical protein [Alphaproteobacteria bacterium]